jgi:hypothetical protein
VRVAVNTVSIFVYLNNRVQEEEFIKLATNLGATQLEMSLKNSACMRNVYPKMLDLTLQNVNCSEAIEFLKKLETLPS